MKLERRSGMPASAAWLLATMLFLGSAYFYQDPEWNGNSRLSLTRAIVEQGTLRIDAYHEAPGWGTGDKAYFEGHFYTDKAIGASILAAPLYFLLFHFAGIFGLQLTNAAIKHVLTTGVMGALFTLTGLSMYSIALRIASRAWMAVMATLCLTFGTMLWPYSAVFYGHVPAAAFLALTFALLIHIRKSGEVASPRAWLCIGLAVGLAFLSDFTTAPVILGLGAYALYVLKQLDLGAKVRSAWAVLPGLGIPLIVLVAYNMQVYRTPLAFGYSYEVEERFQEIMGLGLMGMRLPALGASYHISIDPRFGLLWLSPVLVLAPLGYWVAHREGKYGAECLLSLYVVSIVFLMNAASHLWYGGSTFGPRLMISSLPFFIVPIALLPNRWSWVLAGLGLLSAANMMIPLLGQIQYTRLEFDAEGGGFSVAGVPFRGFSLLYEYGLPEVWRRARSGESPWTLGSTFQAPLWVSVLALLLIEGTLLAALRRVCHKAEPEV